MFAYRVPRRFGDGERVNLWPELRRIAAVGPPIWWRDGDATMVGIKPICPQPIHPDMLVAPVDTEDGMQFFAPKNLPTPGEVRHDLDSLPFVVTLTTALGMPLDIVPATMAPRQVVFSVGAGATAGGQIGEYAEIADRLHQIAIRIREIIDAEGKGQGAALADEKATLLDEDARLTPRCCVLAVQQAYYVTEEMLNMLGWITTTDLDQIIMAAWGIDPKAPLEPGSGADG